MNRPRLKIVVHVLAINSGTRHGQVGLSFSKWTCKRTLSMVYWLINSSELPISASTHVQLDADDTTQSTSSNIK